MLATVQQYIKHHQLLQPDRLVVVGVSGGADSVALLHVLLGLGYPCVAAHCNFQLRGAEADSDEHFVRKLCEQWDIPLVLTHFPTADYAREHQLSVEMAARELRYRWFAELQERLGAQAVAVAHHADDQAETVLLNLLRGSGLRGLGGMHNKNGNVVRPMLCATRRDIENYLALHHLPHITDSTNADTAFRRNKIRHQLLPLMEEINPAVRQQLAQSARYWQQYYRLAEQQIAQFRAAHTVSRTDGITIQIAPLAQQAAGETILFELLRPFGFAPDQSEQLFAALSGPAGKQFVAAEYRAVKDRDTIVVERLSAAEDAAPTLQILTRERVADEHYPATVSRRAFFDAKLLEQPLTLRHWQHGDYFYPIGLKGRKKVSDFFTDQKLSLLQKEQVWLLFSGDQLAWIIGYRIDDRYKITDTTTQVVEITVKQPKK